MQIVKVRINCNNMQMELAYDVGSINEEFVVKLERVLKVDGIFDLFSSSVDEVHLTPHSKRALHLLLLW